MSTTYYAMAMFFFLLGCGCLLTSAYIWKTQPMLQQLKQKQKQKQETTGNETVMLTEEWEECLWKSTNRHKCNG